MWNKKEEENLDKPAQIILKFKEVYNKISEPIYFKSHQQSVGIQLNS